MSHISWSSAGGTELKKQNVLGKFPFDPADRTKHLSLLFLLLLLLWKHRGFTRACEWGMLLLSMLFAWIDTNMKEICTPMLCTRL